MFEDLELTTAQGMSAQELGIYIDFWLDIADTGTPPVSMRSIWSNLLTPRPCAAGGTRPARGVGVLPGRRRRR
ncbi:hypothetical protein QJS66_08945 [Kocuria rhizophila]|nr:hypothetical protein QJS66_08945 [Kocuria rhizophila]